MDLIDIGIERRLIFTNIANGVPEPQVMVTFKKSQLEVHQAVNFVCRKIREYRFRRRQPPVACDTVNDIMLNKRVLLLTLSKLGPKYLASELILPRIGVEKLDNMGAVMEISRRVQNHG